MLLPLIQRKGYVVGGKNAIYKHTVSCSSLQCIDLNKIKVKFKVVVDAVNGAGALALPTMLDMLGCEVIKLDCEPNGCLIEVRAFTRKS